MSSELQLFRISMRIFKRDWRRGALLTLIFAVVIAMASVSVIYLVIDRIENAMAQEVSDVLGADLVITSPEKVPPEWLEHASNKGLRSATSVEFSSVLFANEKLQLSSIKAISDNYPLKGAFELTDSNSTEIDKVNHKPATGEVWLEPRIWNLLNLNDSQLVEVGYMDLKASKRLVRQPGQGSTLFNIAPTAIISIDDLEATKIIQPGSRVNYRYLFTGEVSALREFAEKIEEEKTTSQRVVSVFDESPIAGSALTRSKKYMGLSTLLTMILLGVAIAMSANRYAKKQFDMSALMRCFGMSSNEVVKVFMYILTLICLTGVITGGIVGIAFQEVVTSVFAGFFVDELPKTDYLVLVLPMFATCILLFGFSLPSMIQIKQVSPMRVLRRQLAPIAMSHWIIYGISIITLVVVMWMQMGDLKLLMSVLLGLVLVIFVFSLIAVALFRLMKKFAPSNHAAVNFSLRQLDANKGLTLMHLLAFSITIFVIALVILIRSELLNKWQQSLGEEIPNHFLVNVKPEDVKPLEQLFQKNELKVPGLYPMIRGRIVGINGESIKTAVPLKGQQHNSVRRELNITWTYDLPEGNKVVDGNWQWDRGNESIDQPSESKALPLISIEDKTANALDLTIGDTLDFSIGSDNWSAKIVSIRSIDWQTFTPNFYIIASPDSLNDFSATYIASFYLPKEKKSVINDLVKKHPTITLIELDVILSEIQSIIAKVSKAVELIMIFVVAAGIALLWAAMEHTFDTKYKQSAILRTLGASKRFISRSFRFEYFWLAMISAFMAIFAVESVSFILYSQVFEIEFGLHWYLWWSIPVLTLILMLLTSWRGVRKVTEPAPLTLIRGG